MKYYFTIKEIEKIAERTNRKIIEVRQENKQIVIVIDNGIKIKIKNY